MAFLNWAVEPSLVFAGLALNALHHRGPDASNIWQSPNGRLTLGHARLSIVDLVTGNQPIVNEDGSIHLVVNGEFYDFEAIRSELESLGHHFRTRSDSEIAIHLYEEFGIGCLQRLRGEYAFVLWNEREQTLLAVRDRFGIKPLFYSQNGGRLWFASEVKALHAAGIEACWDEVSFLERIAVNTPLQGRTLFRKISELPPAHYLLATPAGVVIRPYWDFDYPPRQALESKYSDDEYAEQLAALLDEAVRVRTRADVPLGCYVSGGIDSGTVLGLMRRHVTGRLRAFCVTFDDPTYDESLAALEMTEKAGAEFNPVLVTQAQLAADFQRAIWHAETLFMNAHSIAKFSLSRAVHNAGLKVVLTGEGSDEIFGGYSIFVRDAIGHGSREDLVALASSLGVHYDTLVRKLEQSKGRAPAVFMERLGYVPSGFESQNGVLQLLKAALPQSFDSDVIYSRLLEGLDLPHQLLDRSILNQSLYLHSKTMLPGYTLSALGDRMEMAHAVEGRPPFLDHHVVEFARHLPVSQKIRGTAEKFVLRKAMRSVVTPTLCGRRKQAFLAPPALLNPTKPLHHFMQDTLRSKCFKRVPFLNQAAVVQLLDVAPALNESAKALMEVPLMLILSACVLAEQFKL